MKKMNQKYMASAVAVVLAATSVMSGVCGRSIRSRQRSGKGYILS